MILALRNWLTAVLAAAMLVSAAEKAIPEGAVRKAASVTGGLLLLLVLIRPLSGSRGTSLFLDFRERRLEIQTRQEELEAGSREALAELIEEKTEAYILDKAAALGVECRAEVETETGAGGLPVPYRVSLSCGEDAALSAVLAEELGIPRERQVFHGEG